MTREDAINRIMEIDIRGPLQEDYDALNMAIKALEQEPCEDAISRQAAIDVIERWLKCSDYNEAERHIMRATESILYDLPSVNPPWREVLDKIRAEIKSHELDPNDTDQFGTGVNFGIGYALGIIDKYKAESEG